MKQKTRRKGFLAGGMLLLLSACLLFLSGCDIIVNNDPPAQEHTHAYSTFWAQDATHHWHTATCEHTEEKSNYAAHSFSPLGICSVCNYRRPTTGGEGDTHQHTFAQELSFDESSHWHAATCEHKGMKDAVTEHSFSEWAVATPATCEVDGEEERHCTACSYRETKKIKAAHTYSDTLSYDNVMHYRPATCEHTDKMINKTPHTMGAWTTVTPTCETEGSRTRKCTGCDYTEEESLGYGSHPYDTTVWVTSETHHYHAASCSHAAGLEPIDRELHAFGQWVTVGTPATCMNAGESQRICATCNYIETRIDPQLPHSYASTVKRDENNHWLETNCGIHDTMRVEVAAHTYAPEVVELPASCQTGATVTKTCSYCNYIHREVKATVDPNTHVYESTWTTDKDGHWHAATCDCADAPMADYQGHTYGQWVVTTPATCQAFGTESAECSTCQKVGTRLTADKNPENHTYETEWTQDTETHYYAPTCDCPDAPRMSVGTHQYSAEVIQKEPTCLENGAKEQHCLTCGKTKYTLIPATGHSYDKTHFVYDTTHHWYTATCEHAEAQGEKAVHDYGEWYEFRAPTCMADGESRRSCKDCTYYEVAAISATVDHHPYEATWTKNETHHYYAPTCSHSEALKLYGEHNYGENGEGVTVEISVTCGNAGLLRYTCLDCGYSEKTEVVPKLDHTYSNKWSNDLDYHWHRAICGHDVPPIDHARHDFPDEWTVTREPTCEEKGSHYKACRTCSLEIEEEIPIVPTAHSFYADGWGRDETHHWNLTTCIHTNEKLNLAEHDFGEWEPVTAPTCGEDGEQKRTCATCGYTEAGVISATGNHAYGAWEVVTTPVCGESNGEQKRVCSVCDDVDTAVIPMADAHLCTEEASEVTREPTCTEDGIRTYACTRPECNGTKEVAIPATGHSYADTLSIDEENGTHYYAATCGCDLRKDENAHAYGAWENRQEDDHTYQVRTCADCGHEERLQTDDIGGLD